ncbi:MFS transporter [Streptomyces daliensis]|uniref:MFS transporter n=1 Tax=Streptomyces daliensis TaxID=299421 RepID=A0A8T4IX37_9ACTN|nr:MFS transporter [Streptomyces daliensis]
MAAELTPRQKRRTHRAHRTYQTYRAVIGLGGPLLPVVSFLGRLPTAMCQLGTLLLVAETSGSLGTAGLVGGALAAGQTVGGPFVGRLADRHGQRRVVLAASCLNAVAVAALVAAALGHAPTAPLAALGVVAGLSVPQVGPLARTRLVALAHGADGEERTLAAVFSLEGTLDEVSFVLGPALVGVAAAVAHPAVALALASALLVVCGSAFALHPTARATAPSPSSRRAVRGRSLRGRAPRGRTRDRRTPRRTVYALGASAALQGGMFGACQAGITALTGDLGVPEQSGLVYGAMGAMSAVVGLAMASVPPSVGLPTRWRLATGAALVLSLPLLTVGSLFALYAVVVVLGCAYAPHLITLSGLTERAVPAHRLAESMAFMTSAVVGGQALALAVAGPLAEGRGPGAAFAVTVGSAALALLLALLVRPRTSDEAYRTAEPAEALAAPASPAAPADAVTSAPPATRGAATPPGSGRSG